MRWALDLAYLIAGIFLLPVWLWKLPRARRYRAGIIQRLGFSPLMPPGRKRLWIHCASVGEAGIPSALTAGLRQAHPDWDVVFSTNTDTGLGRLRQLYPGSTAFYMPLDFSVCVRRALRRVRPDAVILVELEVWPNFLGACRSSGTPVGVVNGRIGAFSRRALGALSRLLPRMWEPVRVCCARSEDDAGGFVGAGLPAERVFNCGSLKYDALPAQADAEEQERLRRLLAIGPGAPVLVAGSTHPGEESVLVRAYRELREEHRGLRLILAPRHVERGGRVAAIVQEAGLPVVRKSELDAARTAASGKDVIVVDTLGDLLACYSLATCAFVGRSLIEPGGGQNVMEPAALGKPVLVGPHTGNFKPDMALLMARGAVSVVRDAAELGAEVQDLLSNPSRAELMGRAGRSVVEESRGATGRTLERLEALFGSGPAGEPTAA